MSTIRSVIKPDGTLHLEQTIGNMRIDLTDNTTTYTLDTVGDMQTVIRPDGTLGTEQTFGGLRHSIDQSSFDQLLP